MKIIKTLIFILTLFVFYSCNNKDSIKKKIDELNQKAFEYRSNSEVAVNSVNDAFTIINSSYPDYVRGKAMAWNNLAMIYFLQNDCKSSKCYTDSVIKIKQNYENKDLETDIALITQAKIYSYEIDLYKEWEIYLDKLQLFQIDVNKIDLFQPIGLSKFDTLQLNRYYYAKSEYYFALLRMASDSSEKDIYREILVDTIRLPEKYLDTYQRNELLMRHSYYCYEATKDTLLKLAPAQRVSFLTRCFNDFRKWYNILDPIKDPQHVANFGEQFVRILTDNEIEEFRNVIKKDNSYSIYNLLCDKFKCDNKNSLSELLLKNSLQIAEKRNMSTFDIAWYYLMLGDFYFKINNNKSADNYFKIYSNIEKKTIDSLKNSLRLYRLEVEGYVKFLDEKSKNDSIYQKLKFIFEKEEKEKFHDDRVLLDALKMSFEKKRELKQRYITKTKRLKNTIYILSGIISILTFAGIVGVIYFIKCCNLLELFKDDDRIKLYLDNRKEKKLSKKKKAKIILKRMSMIMILIIALFVILIVFKEDIISFLISIILACFPFFVPKFRDFIIKIW